MWRYRCFFFFLKTVENWPKYDHFRRAIDKPREIVKIIITKQNDLLIRAHRRFAYIDLIAGDVEIQVFLFGKRPKTHRDTAVRDGASWSSWSPPSSGWFRKRWYSYLQSTVTYACSLGSSQRGTSGNHKFHPRVRNWRELDYRELPWGAKPLWTGGREHTH